MDPSLIDPELRVRALRLPRLPLGYTVGRWLVRTALRLAPSGRVGRAPQRIALGQGVGLRLYVPEHQRTAGALLWIHGGGFVIGHAGANDGFCASLASQFGMVVVSLDYRLAPEHPYPAALNDGIAAWAWLQSRAASLGVDPRRIIIGGQSAGGGLAASLVQRICREPGPGPLGQWLFCPMLDDRTAADLSLDAVDHPLWSNRLNRVGWAAYLGLPTGAQPPDGAVPARAEDLSGLPPAWIGCGTVDLFFEENRRYAERLGEAGVAVVADFVPGAPHGFELWGANTRCASTYMQLAKAWLADRLAQDPD